MWPFRNKQDAAPGELIEPKAFQLPPKVPAKHQTFADVLDYWCKKHNATYERRVETDGVVVRVLMDGGDTALHGKGATTAEAVTKVVKLLEAL